MPIVAIPDEEACDATRKVLDLFRALYKADPAMMGSLLSHHVTASALSDTSVILGVPLATQGDRESSYLGVLGLLNAVLRACSHTQIGIALDNGGGISDFVALRSEP